MVVAPALLALLELFHPHPHDLLALDTTPWLAVHYAQIPLFALTMLSLGSLVRDRADLAALVCRAGLLVFAITYIAFDTIAGVGVGILIREAQSSPRPEAWLPAIEALWTHPVMGGEGVGDSPSFAVIGRVALSIGTLAGAFSLKRSGCSWWPVLVLAIAGCGLNLFHAHSWPGGPLTFGGLALAAGWLRSEQCEPAALWVRDRPLLMGRVSQR